jgi:hypothetical protein
MKLEIREIASPMVGPTEPRMNLQAPSQCEVIALAERIPLRDVLTEMHLVGADLDRGTNVVVNATSTVVAMALPVKGPILKRAR